MRRYWINVLIIVIILAAIYISHTNAVAAKKQQKALQFMERVKPFADSRKLLSRRDISRALGGKMSYDAMLNLYKKGNLTYEVLKTASSL